MSDGFVNKSLWNETYFRDKSETSQSLGVLSENSAPHRSSPKMSLAKYRLPTLIKGTADKNNVSSLDPTDRFLTDGPRVMAEIAERNIFPNSLGLDLDLARHGESVDFDEVENHSSIFDRVRNPLNLQFFNWLGGILLLLSLLFIQYGYLRMDELVHEPRYRPYYDVVCRYLGCSIPEFHNLSMLQPRELVVRTHPIEKDALILDALLRNSGDYRQFFPDLRLRFFDVDGNIVASRVFRGSEYLAGEMRGLSFIPGNTEVRFSLEVVDPGKQALGYQIDVIPYGTPK